ncbi:MAG: hypothetical protein MJZ16_07185, partial [Bacteroidales bacterium]|nr:hypothetical protein [Bacteroidales bacterium]
MARQISYKLDYNNARSGLLWDNGADFNPEKTEDWYDLFESFISNKEKDRFHYQYLLYAILRCPLSETTGEALDMVIQNYPDERASLIRNIRNFIIYLPEKRQRD